MPLNVSSHVLEPSPIYPYAVTAKRYWETIPPTLDETDPSALTIILAHATGMHKESFEPVLEKLFELASAGLVSDGGKQKIKIREAWAIDCINHGEAATLNEKRLPTKLKEVFEWEEYGRAIGHFLIAGSARGARVDFSKRNLCGIGHSMGAVSLIWLEQSRTIPIKFQSLFLIEPMLSPPGMDVSKSTTSVFVPAAYTRRDVWPSRSAALKEFNAGKGYKRWDRRVLSLFVEYGLRLHPSADFTVGPYNGIVLACTRESEAACYRGSSLAQKMVGALAPLSHRIPIHILWGEVEDSLPRLAKEVIVEENKTSIRFASVAYIPNAGHLAVQHSPTGVAEALYHGMQVQTKPVFLQSHL